MVGPSTNPVWSEKVVPVADALMDAEALKQQTSGKVGGCQRLEGVESVDRLMGREGSLALARWSRRLSVSPTIDASAAPGSRPGAGSRAHSLLDEPLPPYPDPLGKKPANYLAMLHFALGLITWPNALPE